MADEPVYEARGVGKSYGSVVALDNVDLAVRAGEVVGLVGDNGAGKSTLVKVLSGVHEPDAGSVYLDGVQRVWRSPHEALEALEVGIETLYQDAGLCPDLTVNANVFLGRERLRPGLLGKLGFLDNKTMAATARAELEQMGVDLTVVLRLGQVAADEPTSSTHQALCYFGYLLGHSYVHEAIADPDVRALLAVLGCWACEAGVDGAVQLPRMLMTASVAVTWAAVVRRQGLEPRTRWFQPSVGVEEQNAP